MAVSVSVVIPAYCASRSLKRAVQSVQRQTFQDFEIIIVDDASPDNTIDAARSLAALDERLRLFLLSNNSGPSAARNKGIDEARGKWVAILDADDAFVPERLQKLITMAEQNNLDMVADNLSIYDAPADQLCGVALPFLKEEMLKVGIDYYLKNDFSGGVYSLSIIKPIFRRSFLQDRNIRYPTKFRHGEDSHFYTLVFLAGAQVGFVPEAYYLYTATVGPVSRKRSVFSQTKVDFFKKAQSCFEIQERFGSKLPPSTRKLLLQRGKRNQALHALQLIKAFRIVDFCSYALHYPDILAQAMGIAIQKIFRKIRSRFLARGSITAGDVKAARRGRQRDSRKDRKSNHNPQDETKSGNHSGKSQEAG